MSKRLRRHKGPKRKALVSDYFTAQEAGEYLQISAKHIDAMCARGQIMAFKISDKPKSPWRIHIKDLNAYVMQRYQQNISYKPLTQVLKKGLAAMKTASCIVKEPPDIPSDKIRISATMSMLKGGG